MTHLEGKSTPSMMLDQNAEYKIDQSRYTSYYLIKQIINRLLAFVTKRYIFGG